MIVRIWSSLDTFKQIHFQKGLNVLLSDTHPDATEKQTRNSAGKTSLIEIVHFLLGADCRKDSLFKCPELVEHSFMGDFSFGDHVVSVERSGSIPARIYLLNGFDGRRNLPIKIEKGSERQYLSNKHWRVFLGHLLFGLPEDLMTSVFGESYTPSFRSMISYFARRQQSGGFISPERQAERQQRWDWQENLSYLFGLDWRIPNEFQKISLRVKALEELRRAEKAGAFGEIIGTVAELRPAVAVAKKKAEERKAQLRDFRVHKSYDELSSKAANAKTKMQALARENVSLRETLNHLEKALEEEIAPESRELEKVYESASVELPGVALKRLSEVRAFYESVVENRRLHLNHEINSLRDKLEKNSGESEQLDDERQKILKILESHGALEDFIALQKELSELEAAAASLRERFKAAEFLEGERTQLGIDRSNLHKRLQRDFQERKSSLDEVILVVSELISGLYDDRSGRFEIAATDKGPEFKISIEGDRGGGIANMEIFCLDMALMKLGAKNGLGPGFLIHDSHLFDGVDERQISRALELGLKESVRPDLQYIVTMNSDIFDRLPLSPVVEKRDVVLATRLSDQTDTGGLFGFRFE